MKILYYNWVDYLDPEKRGGGVSIYQRNLLAHLDARGDTEAHFLSSGIPHEFLRRKPRWRELPREPGDALARRFVIINSGLMSPSHAHYGSPRQVSHAATEDTFMDFVAANGPYDVIHFNNLEGLPAAVLRLKKRWPQTRVVISLHNYYPFCPQVNLWHNEAENCTDFEGGRRCATCLPVVADPSWVRLAHAISWRMQRLGMGPGTRAFDKGFWPLMGVSWRTYRKLRLLRRPAAQPAPLSADVPARDDGRAFAERRKTMVSLINTHADAVLAVSDRVRQIATHHGVAPDKLHTSYIGTKEAEKWHITRPRSTMVQQDGTIRLAYLGYMRRDKGFFFLLDALESLPQALASRVRLTVAARRGEAEALARLQALSSRLAEVRHVEGYSHDGLDALLADVDLGLIPVMWEDNLPQVAIEMHARHIPLMTSDRGGAQELGNCPDLVFRAGDRADFARVLDSVLSGRITAESYWKNAREPVSMHTHLDQLLAIYEDAP
ncbi:MAG: Glycosyltransferase [Rhodobacteraceae bacterium HLUCCA12]|nr:MAG: Glycosyltransferase [Rhodobacteraceae bacterium HLUCCA12]